MFIGIFLTFYSEGEFGDISPNNCFMGILIEVEYVEQSVASDYKYTKSASASDQFRKEFQRYLII